MPAAEQRRLALAAHLALQAMLADQPQDAWIDLPAAVAVAAEVLEGLAVADDALQAVERAGKALVHTAGLPTPTDEAKAACGAFLPYYEALLSCVTWRRLMDAQRAVGAAWASRSDPQRAEIAPTRSRDDPAKPVHKKCTRMAG